MKKSEAVAVANEQHYLTLGDMLSKAADFLYGNKQRAQITMAAALGMLIISKMLMGYDHVQRYACVM